VVGRKVVVGRNNGHYLASGSRSNHAELPEITKKLII